MKKTVRLSALLLCALLGIQSVVGVPKSKQKSASKKEITLPKPLSVRLVESEMIRFPKSWQLDFLSKPKWDYCVGLSLGAMMDVYDRYGNDKIWEYVLSYPDTMINDKGEILTYKVDEYNIDRINSGKFLFRVYDRTKDPKIKKAIDLLHSQFNTHPRTTEGGFWHKKVYPNQMWLDGLYMGAPFYAEYAIRNNCPHNFKDVINQFIVVARHTYDPQSQLFKHAWDESKRERWSDPVTGQSKHVWGRAMGWYTMALVDALEFIPQNEAGRDSLLTILNHIAKRITEIQEPTTGLWYQVLDCSGDPGNYLESSASSMFIYSLLKAVRLGYIDSKYKEAAMLGFNGFKKVFVDEDENGVVSVHRSCAVAGLGGKVYRSGDFNYYITEKIRSNDPKAVAPFIKACLEVEGMK